MTSYFSEHDCEPLNQGEAPDHFLHFARLIATGGYWDDVGVQYSDLFGGKPPPPTSKSVIEDLKTTKGVKKGEKCAICLKVYDDEDEQKHLACSHFFHTSCIIPWLSKTNTCPVCRFEMKTDDEVYEEYRNRKKHEAERKAQLETLHNSMFS